MMVAVTAQQEQEAQKEQQERLQMQAHPLFLRKRPLEDDEDLASETDETPVDGNVPPTLKRFHAQDEEVPADVPDADMARSLRTVRRVRLKQKTTVPPLVPKKKLSRLRRFCSKKPPPCREEEFGMQEGPREEQGEEESVHKEKVEAKASTLCEDDDGDMPFGMPLPPYAEEMKQFLNVEDLPDVLESMDADLPVKARSAP